MKRIYYMLIFSVLSVATVNAQTETFKDQEYIKNGDSYEMTDPLTSEKYPITRGIITLKYKPKVSESEIQNFESSNDITLVRKAATGWWDYQIPNTPNVIVQAKSFLNNPLVEDVDIPKLGSYNNVTPDEHISIPNDVGYGTQWYLSAYTGIKNIENAWDLTRGNPSITVGILDSGTDWTHIDNNQNIFINTGEDAWPNQNVPSGGNGIDDDGNGLIDDWKGWDFHNNNNDSRGPDPHGSHVAGIVGAKTNNNIGIAGIAGGWGNSSDGVKMLICGVGDTTPNGAILDDAIIYAAQMGVKVIQMSVRVPFSSAIEAALQMAHDTYGVSIVVAAGNSGLPPVAYPASSEFAMAVGATSYSQSRASFSSFGLDLFLVAPGENIYSTRMNNQYLSDNGTSFAAPIVSGVVALMYSVNPCLSNIQVRDILKQTANTVGNYNYNSIAADPGRNFQMGYGMVNPHKAVKAAQDLYSTTLDLYVKDSPDDFGTEPNAVTQHMWTSKDIWVRNSNDNGLTHQNPEYRSNGNPNYINIRVINKSCVASAGNETLHVNWAKANTALAWPQNWNGSLQNTAGFDLGDALSTVTLPSIPAGGEYIAKIPWVVPNPINYSSNADPWHFCLLARVNAAGDPLAFPLTSNVSSMARSNNNMAWKNLTVVDQVADKMSAMVMVANPSNIARAFFLEFQNSNGEEGKPIFEEAEVTIKMDGVLFNAWERGGQKADLLTDTSDKQTKLIAGDNAVLGNIMFKPNEMALLTFEFNFLEEELTDKAAFTYHVVQKDAKTREVIGGETFLIKKNPRPVFTADAADYMDYGEIQLEVESKPGAIERIFPNPASDQVQVHYKLNGVRSAYLMVIGNEATKGASNNYALKTERSRTDIDLSNYRSGIYTVVLVCDGRIADAKKMIKQ